MVVLGKIRSSLKKGGLILLQKPFLIDNRRFYRAYLQKLQECGVNSNEDLKRQYKKVMERKSGLSRSQREFIIKLFEEERKIKP